jgi:hypothetical protein
MSPSDEPRDGSTRREFGLAVAATATGALGARAADKDEVPPPHEALLAVVRARFAGHIGPEQLEAVRRGVRRVLTRADELKRLPLQNGDDPAFAFRADLP